MSLGPRCRMLAALLATVAITGCGTQPGAERAASPSAPSGQASSSALAPSASPGPAGAQVVRLDYAGGQVTGATGRATVALGSIVTLEVTSDTADEVHLHGYDESVPVIPGAPATLTFTADIPGVFEVELEESGVPLTQLQVS